MCPRTRAIGLALALSYSSKALSTTAIRPMRAEWTASGACTSGWTAPPRVATRRASGGAATTSTASAEASRECRWPNGGTGDLATHGFRASVPAGLFRRLGTALRLQRGSDDPLLHHVGDGRDADARWLDDVDGVDAHARTDVVRCRGVVPRHVDRHDGSDDAAILGARAVALPPGRRQERRSASGSADRTGERGVFLRVGLVWNGRLSAGRRAGGSGDAAAGTGARRSA